MPGEALYEAHRVTSLLEFERHLWVARVGENEVEIQISPSRVKAYTCDCLQFRKEKGCPHIAAALLALRKGQEQRLESKVKNKETNEGGKKKATLLHLLDQIPPEELIDFVRDYARQNHPFALALKARFTGSLPVGDRREQYLELLESAINGVRSKSDQVSFRGGRQLVQVVRELLGQAEDAISRRYLQEAAVLLSAILEKIGPIARKTAGKDKKLEETLREVFRHFKQLLLLNPAPELVQSIWDFSLRESKKFMYRQTPIQLDYFYLQAQLCPLLGKTDELLEHFQLRQQEMDAGDSNRPDLLILIHKLLIQKGDLALVQTHLLDHLHEPAFVLYAVEEALATGNWKKARFLAEKGLEHANSPVQAGRLEEHLFQLALREKDREAILNFGVTRYLQSKTHKYLEHLKKYAGNEWPFMVDSLLEKLEQQPFSQLKRDAIAQLLYEEGRLDALSQYISRLQSLDLLQQYGYRWPADRQAQVEELYMDMLKTYLVNHLGRKPSQRVREMLEHLLEVGRDDVADRLLSYFRQSFSERQSLMEELEPF
ncbi:MAG: hypothetical protein IPJ40_23615 [Saprospirales bacterium]|nr:hypothetical protein [Saprospirales bacterium]